MSCYVDYAPSFGRGPFGHYICTSVNDAVLHGLPHDYALADGDLLTLDLAVSTGRGRRRLRHQLHRGRVAARRRASRMIDATERALAAGIAAAGPGARIGDISHAIGTVLSEAGYPINTEFGGHGIGSTMHQDPHVANTGRPGRGYTAAPRAAAGPGAVGHGRHRRARHRRRRLDAAQRDRLPDRAQRAHHRHHRRRRRDPHPAEGGARWVVTLSFPAPGGRSRSHALPDDPPAVHPRSVGWRPRCPVRWGDAHGTVDGPIRRVVVTARPWRWAAPRSSASPRSRRAPPAAPVAVQLLALNDFHGNLEPPTGSTGSIDGVPAGGVECLATQLGAARATGAPGSTRSRWPPAT